MSSHVVSQHIIKKGTLFTVDGTTFDLITSGLVLNIDASIYSCYSGTGTTIYDLSGYGNNMTLVNGASYSPASGGQFVFDGTNQYAVGTYNAMFDLPFLTLSAFVKFDEFPVYNTYNAVQILCKTEVSGYALRVNDGNDMLVHGTIYNSFGSGGYHNVGTDIGEFNLNSWYSVTMTYDQTTINFYVNGTLMSYAPCSYNPYTNTEPITLAANPGTSGTVFSEFLRGKIGEAQIYNRALTDTEVASNFSAHRSRYGI